MRAAAFWHNNCRKLRYNSKLLIPMKQLFMACAFFACFTSFAQQNTTVKAGEKLVFTASYNMSGLMTQLAQVTMETANVKTSKATLLHLKCTAATYSKWDSYFKIRDLYESYVNPANLKPVMHKRDVEEGNYKKQMKYAFNYKNKNAKVTLNKKDIKDKVSNVAITPTTNDVVSLIYQLRNSDLSTLQPGGSKQFTLLFDEKLYPVTVKLMGKETIDAGPLGKKLCYKLSVSAKTDKLKGKDQNLIWLTADAKKIPVFMKFNIPVGTGQLQLKSAAGI